MISRIIILSAILFVSPALSAEPDVTSVPQSMDKLQDAIDQQIEIWDKLNDELKKLNEELKRLNEDIRNDLPGVPA